MLQTIDYSHEYVAPDATVLYHEDDPALKPIRLSLPNPPRLSLIDGYGLPAKKQKFKRNKYPDKLKRLEELALQEIKEIEEGNKAYKGTFFKVQREFWSQLDKRRDYYDEEIKWLQKTWWHIFNGYWFFNNGKPTYITGWHYYYLNFWQIDGQFYPDYRDRDRKEFIFFDYSYTTTETFAKLDKNGFAIPEQDGSYEMVDVGSRTCFGVGQNKNRRSGNTNKGLLAVWVMTSTHRGTDGGGIMSMSGDSAEEHMKQKLIPSWKKIPMVLKPITYTNPTTSIRNQAPKTELGVDDLGNSITAAGTATANFFDGKKLWCILVDESGKAKNLDVRERHNVLQHCLAQGNGTIIHGWEYQPSTAEELLKGGKAYKGLLDDSNFYRRNELTGQTRSGLFRLFIPADEALDGYIDEYGYSVKGKKLSPEHRKMGFRATATQVLISEREQLLRDSKTDPEATITYRGKKKQFPLCYDDSWIGGAGDIGFDMEIIDNRLAELVREEEPEQRGNFEWAMGFGSPVVWKPDPVNGKWYVSKLLSQNEANKKYKDTFFDTIEQKEVDVWFPRNPNRFTCGADPYQFKTKAQAQMSDTNTGSKSGKGSDGGIAVFWHRDEVLDPEDKPIKEWESNRFVCTYRYRESDQTRYVEDVLKTCIYYGAMCFPEINIRDIWNRFREWGYDGYLKYQMVLVNGIWKPKDFPGVQQLERSKQEGFSALRDHIALHGMREKHENLLIECKSINAIEEMTKYDLLASAICALLGARSNYSKIMEEENEMSYDIGSAFGY